ncbi:MAG: hypothetical protein ABIS00_14630 [Gemmatimonadales bacterium]
MARSEDEHLQSDAYLAKLAAQAEAAARVEQEAVRLRSTIEAAGFPLTSINDIVTTYPRLPLGLSAVLMELLPSVSELGNLDMLVRSLGASHSSIDPTPLISLFEETGSDAIRLTIANTFAESRPRLAAAWILKSLQEPRYGRSREMLHLAAARTSAPADVNPVLVAMLKEMPGHAAMGLAESGTAEEIPALQAAAQELKGWRRTEIERAIKKIVKRHRAHEGPA